MRRTLSVGLVCTWGCLAAASAERKFTPIDLLPHVQKRWSDIEPNTSWTAVPRGIQVMAGVPFKLDGIVEVTGMGAARAGEPKPAQVAGIKIQSKATHIHIFGGTGYAAADGTPIAVLKLNYAGGETRALPIKFGDHVRNWWKEPTDASRSVSDKNSEVAWTGTSPQTDAMNVTLRLFKTRFVNPLPEREILTIDFVSLFSGATPVIVGLALEHGSPGDLNEAEKIATEGRRYLSDLRGSVALRLRHSDPGTSPLGARARLKVTERNRQIDLGTFTSENPGEVRLYFPRTAESLEYVVQGSNFIAQRGTFEKADGKLPEWLELALPGGATIGGRVHSASGEPIASATVTISGITRDAVGQFISDEIARVETDRAGAWQSSSIPKDFDSLSFAVSHPDYRPAEFEQDEEATAETVTRADLLARRATLVLKPAPEVAGVVRDSQGKELPGATVTLRLSENRSLQTVSDPKGEFRIVVHDGDKGDLVVQAKAHAPHHQTLSIKDDLAPLSVTLDKGRVLKGRVGETGGEPLAGVQVAVDSWKGLPLLNWRTTTSEDGRFEWNEAPADYVVLSFFKSGYVRDARRLIASAEEQEIEIDKTFKLSGKVTDAETGEPISAFRILTAQVWGPGEEDLGPWEREVAVDGRSGEYVVERSDPTGNGLRFLIRAEGYRPVASPPLAAMGWHTFDARLERGTPLVGIVKSKEGEPAANVQIATLGTGHLMLSSGKFRTYDGSKRYVETDADGRFKLEEALDNAKVVFVHEKHGFNEATIEQLRNLPEVVLLPWARIEGVLKIGSRNARAGNDVMLAPVVHTPGGLAFDYETFRKTTDDNGRFTVEFVPPGERQLVRLIPIARGAAWSHYTRFSIAPGETKSIQMGGEGRPVIGRMTLSDPARKVDWTSGHHNLSTRFPSPPANFKSSEEVRAWQRSPEFIEAQQKRRSYAPVFSEDGSFRIDDVLPGKYVLNIHVTEPGEGVTLSVGKFIGALRKDIEVPEISATQTDEPFDIGTLTLQVRAEIKRGMPAPPIEAKTLDEQPWSLKSLAGKYVLLDFWATWCGPCVAEIPNLKAAFDKYRSHPRFAMVGLSLDAEIKQPQDFVKKRNLGWTQVFLGEWSKTPIPDAYGVTGIPATFLIDPQGQIVAQDLRGEDLVRTLDRFLAGSQ